MSGGLNVGFSQKALIPESGFLLKSFADCAMLYSQTRIRRAIIELEWSLDFATRDSALNFG